MRQKLGLPLVLLFLTAILAACASAPATSYTSQGRIYLYGEVHSSQPILDKELALWADYYQNQNLRHLFFEIPYFTAAFLNQWMQAPNDQILLEIHEDLAGTLLYTPQMLDFYRQIKKQCPETVFHGTDVGHQHDTTGARYLEELQGQPNPDPQEVQLTKQAIEQGRTYESSWDETFRENQMVKNFIREFEALQGQSVMGIYGRLHTGLQDMESSAGKVPAMANQLHRIYNDQVVSEDLSTLAEDLQPLRVDVLSVAGKEYQASYFGQETMDWHEEYTSRDFWRLEQAYEDCRELPETGDVLPVDNYPMQIQTGQVFVIFYNRPDGTTVRTLYRSDGKIWDNSLLTTGFEEE